MFARLGQRIAQSPLAFLIVWLVLALVAGPLAALAPQALTADTGTVRESEAARVGTLIEKEFGQKVVDNTLIVTESTLPDSDPAFQAAYSNLVAKLEKTPGVSRVTRFDTKNPLNLRGVVNGKNITVTLLEMRLDNYKPVLADIKKHVGDAKIPDAQLFVTGASAITEEFLSLSETDAKNSEFKALPVIAVILVLAFGALVAAGIPLVVGMVSITVTMACVYLLSRVMPVSSFAQSVITMLGLGAGIDYALLMVNRFREELARGTAPREAAANTTRTAGRAVAFSGLTVAIAMGALLVPELTFVRSMGIGGVLVVLVTVIASVTAVPAILALLGERVNMPRGLQFQFASSSRANPFWGIWADRVMKRPWLATILVSAFFLALAAPATGMKLGYNGAFGLAPGVESRRGLELIRPLDLGGSLDTFEVLLDLGEKGFNSETRAQYRKLDAALVAWPDVRLVISPFLTARSDSDATGGLGDLVSLTERSISKNRRYLRISTIPKQTLHATDIPEWETRLRQAAQDAGFANVLLGGAPVGSREFTKAIVGSMPLAIGVVFAATFVLLAIAFRSLLIPLKSIIMNTLTVGAAYGIVTLVIQHGWFASFLNVPTDVGAIDSSLPLVMFAVIFGLSMDYEIFLLSRVQEYHLAGMTTKQAVREAVTHTANIITSAAIIMLVVFGAFVQGSVVANKTIGLGLAVAVALDATLVRLVLVPAVLVLAGEWNWWLPAPLKRLMPKLSLEH